MIDDGRDYSFDEEHDMPEYTPCAVKTCRATSEDEELHKCEGCNKMFCEGCCIMTLDGIVLCAGCLEANG